MTKTRDEAALKQLALRARRHIVEMIYVGGSGHPGGSLSSTEILVSLYFGEMNHKPDEPKWADRDRFVLSKGHIAAGYYSVLALAGYFPCDVLNTFRKLGSPMQGHPCMLKTVGVDMSSGSLGQGLSIGNGMALAARLDGKPYRVYVLMGDGEVQEGQVWEAAMTSAHYKLDNVCAILDYNNLQIDGSVSSVKEIAPLEQKWAAFGWHVVEVDGHNYQQLFAAYDEARATKGKPTIIIARTIKGKGVSYMENVADYHGKAPDEAGYKKAMAELV
ncbi:MAG TPA: transketolase [Hyphomicrobiaceae bacterium]|nr:transketolase [Hyphomicrobiaceae bacterium]